MGIPSTVWYSHLIFLPNNSPATFFARRGARWKRCDVARQKKGNLFSQVPKIRRRIVYRKRYETPRMKDDPSSEILSP